MTAQIPKVEVFLQEGTRSPGTGESGRIAVIGAFNATITEPKLYTSLAKAQAALGTDSTFDGCAALPYLFMSGATSVLAVNITTWSNDDTPVPTKTVTTSNLATALAAIKGEEWDILFVAASLTDAFIPIIDAYLDDTYEMKFPAGYIGTLGGANDAANISLAGLAGDHCYGLLTQQFRLNGTTLSRLNTAAYYCGLVAGLGVGETMTMKTIPYVTVVSPELSFETGGAGKSLLEAGITTAKVVDRNAGRCVIVNSEQPNGLDLYVNRVRDYVVKEMSLHQFLGERNNETTLNEIKHELDRVKSETVKSLNLLQDIVFTVDKVDARTVEINISKLVFDGIITKIDVYLSVEVA